MRAGTRAALRGCGLVARSGVDRAARGCVVDCRARIAMWEQIDVVVTGALVPCGEFGPRVVWPGWLGGQSIRGRCG